MIDTALFLILGVPVILAFEHYANKESLAAVLRFQENLDDAVKHLNPLNLFGYLALATAEGCVKIYPQAPMCWIVKGVQRVHMRQFDEAMVAYNRALALESDAESQQNIRKMLELARRGKRSREIFGK